MSEPAMTGRLYLHMETGYEGPPWALQDERYISKNETTFACAKCHLYWNKADHKTLKELWGSWADHYTNRLENLKLKKVGREKLKQEAVEFLKKVIKCLDDSGHVWQKTSEEHWSYDGMHILDLGDHLKVTKDGKVFFDGPIELGSANEWGIWYPKGLSKEEWINFFDEGKNYTVELIPAAPLNVKMAVNRLMPGYSLVQIIQHRESDEPINDFGKALEVDILWNFASARKPVAIRLVFTPKEHWFNHGHLPCSCLKTQPYDISKISVPGCDNLSIRMEASVPSRLREAVKRYFPDDPAVCLFKKRPVNGLFSFEAELYFYSKEEDRRRITLHFYLQDRSQICACVYKKDKIGRWRRRVRKEERVCICNNLPQDILTSIRVT